MTFECATLSFFTLLPVTFRRALRLFLGGCWTQHMTPTSVAAKCWTLPRH